MIEFGSVTVHICMCILLFGIGFLIGQRTKVFKNVESERQRTARLMREEEERKDQEETDALNKAAHSEFSKIPGN